MAKRIAIKVNGVTAEATLFEDDAPKTVQAFWDRLPLVDRTIQARWSGNAWRTEQNYALLPEGTPVENKAGRLSAGDIIYYPNFKTDLLKIAVAYDNAMWLSPSQTANEVALIGKIDVNLDEFVQRCKRIIFDGPLNVEFHRIEE